MYSIKVMDGTLNILYFLLLCVLRQLPRNRLFHQLGVCFKTVQLIFLEKGGFKFLNEHIRWFSFRISLLVGEFADHFGVEHFEDVVLVDLTLDQLFDLQQLVFPLKCLFVIQHFLWDFNFVFGLELGLLESRGLLGDLLGLVDVLVVGLQHAGRALENIPLGHLYGLP